MPAIKLHVIKPSVNNMTARVFVRAAKLDFTEDDVYGKTRSEEFSARNPSHLTPMMEARGLPKGVVWESCAIMQYLCNKHHFDQFYPTEPEKRAMVDRAMFYIVGTLYPYITRATYPTLGFPQYPGEVGASDADAAAKDKAQKAATAAVGETLDVFRKFYLDGKRPSSAATMSRSPTFASPAASSSSMRSTMTSPAGRRPTCLQSKPRSATPTLSLRVMWRGI